MLTFQVEAWADKETQLTSRDQSALEALIQEYLINDGWDNVSIGINNIVQEAHK